MSAKKEASKAKAIRKYPVRDDENIILIDPSEIIYLMAMEGDVFVITEMGKYKSTDSLNSWENNLDKDHFFRCHRGYIVNIERVEKIVPWFNSAYNLKLKEGKESIPVSRGAMKRLKKLLRF
ncbi:LytTR family transcriptional regulator [Alkaliphilus serpentinus]|uniref:LytTR family transcriptional regulator n=2 Tax=Alkaliphilus serpentinus TaxID=1482731 RepID=A0A833HLL5_9FIRM|nr:LytTR family transcriptional regulator [Alkaliphilus serpentinus]